MSDIILDNSEQITVLCEILNVQGHDFFLDAPTRRKPDGPPFRRAIVHDETDGLTLNFGHDYPGGVTIHDVRTLDVRALDVRALDVRTINLTGDLQFRISHQDEALLNAPAHGGLLHQSDETVKLGDVIKALRREIADLKGQVATLAAMP